ncbi:hypothetical protein QE152_g35291 [Popillia japonica]|uniref:Uncharacterized protein n=1 Tax=Popillia japonica TaxID=7064 RepID=A0AAW1IG87_POPJA
METRMDKLSDGNEDGSSCSSEEKNFNLRNRIRPGTGTIPKGKAAVSEKDGSSDDTSSEQEDKEVQAAQGTADDDTSSEQEDKEVQAAQGTADSLGKKGPATIPPRNKRTKKFKPPREQQTA